MNGEVFLREASVVEKTRGDLERDLLVTCPEFILNKFPLRIPIFPATGNSCLRFCYVVAYLCCYESLAGTLCGALGNPFLRPLSLAAEFCLDRLWSLRLLSRDLLFDLDLLAVFLDALSFSSTVFKTLALESCIADTCVFIMSRISFCELKMSISGSPF